MLPVSLLAAEESVWDDPKWYPTLFDSPMNIARGIFFWLTIALVLAFLLCVLLIKGDSRKKLLKCSLIFFIVYACVVGITLLAFTFAEDGIKTILFVPLLALIVTVAGGAVALTLKRSRLVLIVSGCLVGAALVATLVCMGVYYGKEIADDGYYNSDITSVNQIVLYASAVVLIGVILFLGIFFGRKDKKGFDSKAIAYAAICIAMSFALSYLRIVKMPQGGSVTIASLLPLMIYSYMFGTRKGVFAGFIYGILQAVQDPWIIHPAQFLLDYPIAFSCIGLAGMFANVKKLDKLPQIQFALGAIVASVMRYIAHLLSGVFAFSAYAVEKGMNSWVYSLAYNSFVFIDIAIAIVVGVIVFSSPSFVKQVRKFHTVSKPNDGETADVAQTNAE